MSAVMQEVTKKAGRPTKEATKTGFEAEVVRLAKAGNSDSDIARILRVDRTTVWRLRKRMADSTPALAAEIHQAREYHRETSDEFMQEGSIKAWIEDMKLRRVGKWPEYVNHVRHMCEELQVFPDQLVPIVDPDTGQRDFTWAKRWLATKADVPLDKLRERKNAFRGFAKKYGATDYELTLAGYDSKHYGVGKWKHVQMTEEQIKRARAYLADAANFAEQRGREEALFVFSFGIDTCRPLEPIWNLTADRFYTLEAEITQQERRRIALVKQLSESLPPGMGELLAELLNVSPDALVAELEEEKKTLCCVNIFRKKTEKSGAPYKTAYPSRFTFELAKRLGEKHGGRLMDGFEPEDIYPFLRSAYAHVGARAQDPDDPAKDYFQTHPVHCLRHCGAQRLLQKTGFNRAVVAELGGWEAEKTLEDHYGGVPVDVVRGMAGSLL